MRKKDMNYVENGAKMKVLTPLCLQSEANPFGLASLIVSSVPILIIQLSL